MGRPILKIEHFAWLDCFADTMGTSPKAVIERVLKYLKAKKNILRATFKETSSIFCRRDPLGKFPNKFRKKKLRRFKNWAEEAPSNQQILRTLSRYKDIVIGKLLTFQKYSLGSTDTRSN